MVLECRLSMSSAVGLGDPQLDPVQFGRRTDRGFLGMRDAISRGHQVELTRANDLLVSKAIAMQHLSRQEPRHCLETDMGMRPDPETRPSRIKAPAFPMPHPAPSGPA